MIILVGRRSCRYSAGLSAPPLISDGPVHGPKVRWETGPTPGPGQARRHTILNSFSSLWRKLVFPPLCEQAHAHTSNGRPRLFFVRLIHVRAPVEPVWPFLASVRFRNQRNSSLQDSFQFGLLPLIPEQLPGSDHLHPWLHRTPAACHLWRFK